MHSANSTVTLGVGSRADAVAGIAII